MYALRQILTITLSTAALAVLLTAAPRAAQAQTLTGATVFSTDAAGNTGGNYWDTSSGGGYNLWVSLNGTPLNGTTNANAAISTSLAAPGTYNFTIFGNPGGNEARHGLNLFFDGGNTPSISVFALTANDSGSPPFAANSSSSTRGLNAESVAGAGTNMFTMGGTTVKLDAYRWELSSVRNQDLVLPYERTPGGGADNQGSFTLVVTNNASATAPEPGSIALLLTAGVPVLGIIRRRRAR